MGYYFSHIGELLLDVLRILANQQEEVSEVKERVEVRVSAACLRGVNPLTHMREGKEKNSEYWGKTEHTEKGEVRGGEEEDC